MKQNRILFITLVLALIAAAILLVSIPASADSLHQAVYNTPTPNANGQIIYAVQQGDNCTTIYLKTGVSIDQLIALNNLSGDCEVFPDQELILGTVDPATATLPGPVQSPTPGAATPTPSEGSGEVCVVLFEDLDGNQMRAETELYLSGGVISINNRSGTYSETEETTGGDPAIVEPVCFEEVPEGEYNLSLGIPDGYIATTSLNYALTVSPGDTVVIGFGAQPASQMNDIDQEDVNGGRSPLFLAIGLIFLAGGAGLAFFYIRSRQGT
jgi:LysM repeat protein